MWFFQKIPEQALVHVSQNLPAACVIFILKDVEEWYGHINPQDSSKLRGGHTVDGSEIQWSPPRMMMMN